jgi:hypothetical protein
MAIEGVDYNLLLSAAQRAQDTELTTVLEAAQKGQTKGFEQQPDLISKALGHLAQDQVLRDHPNTSKTVWSLQPIAQQSLTWLRHPGSSGLLDNSDSYTRNLKHPLKGLNVTRPFQPLEYFDGRPLEGQGIRKNFDREYVSRASYLRYRRISNEGPRFKTLLTGLLITHLEYRPSEEEIFFHLTEKGERSLLPKIAETLGAKPEELQQVAERLVKEGVLRPTQKSETERAREAEEGKGPKPRGPVK